MFEDDARLEVVMSKHSKVEAEPVSNEELFDDLVSELLLLDIIEHSELKSFTRIQVRKNGQLLGKIVSWLKDPELVELFIKQRLCWDRKPKRFRQRPVRPFI